METTGQTTSETEVIPLAIEAVGALCSIDSWAAELPDGHRARLQLENIRKAAADKDLAEAYRRIAEMRLEKLEKVIAEDGGGPIVASLQKRIQVLRRERDEALLERDRAREMQSQFHLGATEAIAQMSRTIQQALDG